jgi:hypothetical protein
MLSGDIWRRKASLTQSVANRAARKLAAREEKMNVIDMQRKESVKGGSVEVTGGYNS